MANNLEFALGFFGALILGAAALALRAGRWRSPTTWLVAAGVGLSVAAFALLVGAVAGGDRGSPAARRMPLMSSWRVIEESAPELAARARAAFDAHKHKVLATLRRDGSPRISGIEASFDDGELWLGMMPGSRKALDLRRDPRLALHSASVDPPDDPTAWAGDAKLTGRAVEVDDPALLERLAGAGDQAAGEEAERPHLFRVEITELVHTRVGDPADHLVIDLWQEGKGLRRLRRR